MLVLVATAMMTLLLATTSVAYSLQNAGFSVTQYASGLSAGPRASAWEGTVLWAVDVSDGVYKADAGVPGPGPLTRVSATRINASPVAGYTGVAVGLDGRLYAANSTNVVEIDKTDGHVLRTVAEPPVNPRALAADPLSGDLIVAGASFVWRVTSPATTPASSIYTSLPGTVGTRAIAIGPDGTMFVVTDGGLIYSIESTALAATHPGGASFAPMGAPVPGITGVSVVTNGLSTTAQFLMVSTSAGAVYKVAGLGSTVTPIQVLDGAGAGQQMSTGPDHCAYPAMGTAVLRVADATGACALALAGIVPPVITLANVTGQPPHVNDGTQTIRASLTNAATLSGHEITFTVTGANPMTLHRFTDASGGASISYSSLAIGLDTIVATSDVDGFPTTSNAVAIDWLPAIDTSRPTITFSYTVPPGGQGTPFACDTAVTSDTARQVSCGWFTRFPTIHFALAAHGPSGLSPTASCGDYTLDYQPGAEGHHQTCSVLNGDGQAQAILTVVIDAVVSPPTITASATANGAPYTAGTPTRYPVTVHFVCSSPIPTALQCAGDQTFSAEGTFTASGAATDIAGQTTSTSFGPIQIDVTPPAIAVDSAPYVFGAWTNADVHLVFHCTDNVAVATCPGPRTVTLSTPGLTVTATDTAGNSASFTTGAINIDRTPPTIVASATKADGTAYTAGTLTHQYVTVRFRCGTDGAPITSCPADQLVTSSGSASGTATDAAGNSASTSFSVVIAPTSRERTQLTITSAPFLATGAPAAARLTNIDAAAPLAGETVRFTAAGVTRTAVTDANGIASVDLGLVPGAYMLAASFAGTDPYFPSDASAQALTVFLVTRFVVYAPNATLGATVQFYGGDWSKQIESKDARKGFEDFKGYSDGTQGGRWTARSGDAAKPPRSLPEYIGVILTTAASKTKDTITGDAAGVAIVRVGGGDDLRKPRPYDGKLGDRGLGTVVGRP